MPRVLPVFLLLAGIFSLGGQSTKRVRQGKDYALFFAVQDYDHWAILRNPISDAQSIAEELEGFFGFETEVIQNPSKREILQTIQRYYQKAYTSGSQLLIFFSGHGTFVETSQEGFIVPQDALIEDPIQETYIPHSRLARMIDQIPCRHILVALDACYSGTFDREIALNRGREFSRPGEGSENLEDFIQQRLTFKSRLYLTSGGKERTPDGHLHSPFTEKFLEALRSLEAGERLLTYQQLVGYMENTRPLPRWGQFGSHEPGGGFLFVSRRDMTRSEAFLAGETLLDLRDNHSYPTVVLRDGRRWMAKDLDYEIEGSYYCGGPGFAANRPESKRWAGRQYTWQAAQGVCPRGWSLPTFQDWQNLLTMYGKDHQIKEGYLELNANMYDQDYDLCELVHAWEIDCGGKSLDLDMNECDGKADGYDFGTYWARSTERTPFAYLILSFDGEGGRYHRLRLSTSFNMLPPIRDVISIEEDDYWYTYRTICVRRIQDLL